MMEPAIHAYTFDAAMTLFRVHPSVGAVYAEVAQQFRVEADAAALDAAFRQAWAERKPTEPHTSESDERTWWHGTVTRTFDLAGVRSALDSNFDDLFEVLYARFDDADVWRIYSDVFPALQRLRASGRPLAIVSNFDSRLHMLLANLALAPLFDAVVISAEAGVRKPDPRIFLRACATLETDPAHTCHVGDSLDEDYHAARTAGLQARLLQRGQKPNPAVVCIESLEQLQA